MQWCRGRRQPGQPVGSQGHGTSGRFSTLVGSRLFGRFAEVQHAVVHGHRRRRSAFGRGGELDGLPTAWVDARTGPVDRLVAGRSGDPAAKLGRGRLEVGILARAGKGAEPVDSGTTSRPLPSGPTTLPRSQRLPPQAPTCGPPAGQSRQQFSRTRFHPGGTRPSLPQTARGRRVAYSLTRQPSTPRSRTAYALRVSP